MLSTEAVRYLAAAITVIALYGVGVSMGNLFSTWLNAVARNPEADDKMRSVGMLGFALTESIGLFALLIALLILFK
ncbi:MAG: F0F1 ATP synthase subunit C [Alphaproteobacteria bacterium]|nr:F0F1 ATP synthase subunit C [Alphaproteobacteria bacterium]MBO7454546.1 F0F1 ATP synthase subunit C [Alphaproteobacteria bacterium]